MTITNLSLSYLIGVKGVKNSIKKHSFLIFQQKQILNPYLDFHIWAGAAYFEEVSSVLVTTDFEISSASDAGKFKIRDDRKGSVAGVDTLALLFDRYPPPPRSTCR